MRILKPLAGSMLMLAITAGSALHGQDPPVQVEITTEPSRTVWYTDPVWLVIGGVVLILIIALIISASNRGGTTVIKD